MASYLRRLLGFGPHRATSPIVPTDEVIPTHMFDDTAQLRHYNLLWTYRFDDVLDADKLGESLSLLFQMEGWRKLGGRLRLRSDGKAEIHIPCPFTADRPPVHFTKEHHSMRMSEHPDASKLPKATLEPTTFPSARKYAMLAYGPGAPKHIDDYFSSDRPLFSLHVITFEDGTLVSINFNHMVSDLGGLKAILDAWQLVLAGRQAEVAPFMGFREDPMAGLYKAQPKEEYLLADKQLTGFGLITFGLRLMFEAWWNPKLESRLLCIPKNTMDAFLEAARKELPIPIGVTEDSTNDVFISEGDLMVALINRMMAQSLPANSNRNITTLLPLDPRTRVASVFQKNAAYVGNCPSAIFVFRSSHEAANMPIGDLALESRKAIASQVTEEQMKAVASLAYKSVVASGNIPVFGPSNTLLLVISNWSKAAFHKTVDFSPAILKPADPNLPGNRKPGHPVFYHSQGLEEVDFASSISTIVGRDLDGDFWLTAGLPPSVWPTLLEYLERYSR